jgi:hypothetical protein
MKKMTAAEQNVKLLFDIREVVSRQAEDEGLWFKPQLITEDYLQKALRKLHAVIDDDQELLLVLRAKKGDT